MTFVASTVLVHPELTTSTTTLGNYHVICLSNAIRKINLAPLRNNAGAKTTCGSTATRVPTGKNPWSGKSGRDFLLPTLNSLAKVLGIVNFCTVFRQSGVAWCCPVLKLILAAMANQKRDREAKETVRDLGIYEWSPSQVQSFLVDLHLERWGPIFEEVDGATLTELSEADLKEMLFLPETSSYQKKLLGHVQKLKLEAKSDSNDVAMASMPQADSQAAPVIAPLCDAPAAAPAALAAPVAPAAPEAAPPAAARDSSELQHHQDMTLAVLHTEWEQLNSLREEFQLATSIFEKLLEQQLQRVTGQSLASNFVQEVLKQLREAQEIAVPSPARIPVFGNTGAGKSTLLNAVLRQNVVPTSGWRSCTAVPVELTASNVEVFRGEVHLKSMEEWQAEVQAALQDLLMSDRQRVSRREPVRGKEETPADVAFATLVAVYPEAFMYTRDPWPSVAAAMRELFRIRNQVTTKHAADKVLKFENADGETLAQEVVDYIDSPERDWQPAFFPLVKKVRIICPGAAAHVHPHVVLVDAPGVQDANAARGNVVKKLLEDLQGVEPGSGDAQSVVIVSNIKRAATERVAQEMLSERFRRQLLMDGHYGRLAFVASCTDELTLSELKRNLKLKDVSKETAAALRNASAKEKITTDCFAGLRRIEIQSEQRTQSTDEEFRKRGIAPAVFTTSARDYQKLSGLLDMAVDGRPQVWSTLRDTEIPDFRRWIHAQGQKAQLDALQKGEDLLASACRKLQDGAGCLEHVGYTSRLETMPSWDPSSIFGSLKKIKESQAGIMRTLLTQKLMSAVGVGQTTAAEEGARNMSGRCQPQGRGGLHWGTFKATCRREGEWREDFNELLADPLNRRIAVEWDRVLNQLLPDHVDTLLSRIIQEMWKLQSELNLPLQPFQDAEELVKRHGPRIKSTLQRQQMEVSRQIKETIKKLMTPSYREAAAVSGTGTDVKQKSIIRDQVTVRGVVMFRKASDFLDGELDNLMRCLEKSLEDLVENLASVLKASMQRMAAVGVERQALRELQKACSAAVSEALRKSEERQHRRNALDYSAAEAEVAGKPQPTGNSQAPSSKEAIPNEYFCPISQEDAGILGWSHLANVVVMLDPVTTSDGHTYDRKSIEEWLRTNSTSPNTGLTLSSKALIPNHNLRKLIQEQVQAAGGSQVPQDSLEMELEELMSNMEPTAEAAPPQGEDSGEDAEEEAEEGEDSGEDAEEEAEEGGQVFSLEFSPEEQGKASEMGMDGISNVPTTPGSAGSAGSDLQSPPSMSSTSPTAPVSVPNVSGCRNDRRLRRVSSWLRKRLWKGRS
eukprot:s1043_g7.t3